LFAARVYASREVLSTLKSGHVFCSIIVPVLNEGPFIDDVVERVRGLDGNEDGEIIVVDGDRDGSTLKAISRDDVVKVLSPRGRGRQMNEGAKAARGDVLLFLHADTQLPSNAIHLIADRLRDGGIVAGAFDLGILSDRPVFRIIERISSLRSRATRVPFGDQAIFVRRKYFDEIGGYRDIPIMEDVEIMKRIRKRGDRIAIIGERVRTSARRWEEEGIVRCTVRNWSLQLLYPLGVSPSTLARFYRNDG